VDDIAPTPAHPVATRDDLDVRTGNDAETLIISSCRRLTSNGRAGWS